MKKLSTMVANFIVHASYPYGKGKNDTIPGDGTGTEVLAAWLDEVLNGFYSIIDNSGLVVDDVSETIGTSQVMSGVKGLAALSMPVGSTYNLALSKAAGVITISGYNGTALSATNIGYIALPSVSNPGSVFHAKITANITFNDDDHAASDLVNWLFGVTTGVHWANAMPVSIYGFNKDDTDGGVVIGFSRDPRAESFTTILIGDKDAVPASNTQGSVFIAASITEADYNNVPCVRIGATIMGKLTVADDWTFAATSNNAGFGKAAETSVFSANYIFPVGQNGAAPGELFKSNAGTIPTTLDTYDMLYYLNKDGSVVNNGFLDVQPGNGTAGVGADTLFMATPYTRVDAGVFGFGGGYLNINGPLQSEIQPEITSSGMRFFHTVGTRFLRNSDYSNTGGERRLKFTSRYQAF